MDGFNQPFYNTHNMLVELLNDGVSCGESIISLSIGRRNQMSEKWPGQALAPSQAWIGEMLPDVSVTLYSDDNLAFPNIEPNGAMSFNILSAQDADASYLGSLFARFPQESWAWGDLDTNVEREIGQMTVKLNANVLNPGANGGYV